MWADVRAAFSFLTVLPLGDAEGRKPGWSVTAYPCVGLVIGLLLALIAHLSPFTLMITTFLVLLACAAITGGLHLDGFGDSCDGLLATVEPARRLEIMRDPRTGSWAVIGLVLLLLGKWTVIQAVPPALLILPPVLGCWVMAAIASACALLVVGGIALIVQLGALIVFAVARWAARRLNGCLTGDVYGGLCELTELLCLVGLTLWANG